jgi:hypothetical protein
LDILSKINRRFFEESQNEKESKKADKENKKKEKKHSIKLNSKSTCRHNPEK